MKNASYCVSYGKEGRLQQNEQKNSFCYSPFYCRGATCVKNNIVYILCKDILYTLCKHIVYKFLLIEALIFLLNEDCCESDKPVSSGILAYLRQSSR